MKTFRDPSMAQLLFSITPSSSSSTPQVHLQHHHGVCINNGGSCTKLMIWVKLRRYPSWAFSSPTSTDLFLNLEKVIQIFLTLQVRGPTRVLFRQFCNFFLSLNAIPSELYLTFHFLHANKYMHILCKIHALKYMVFDMSILLNPF